MAETREQEEGVRLVSIEAQCPACKQKIKAEIKVRPNGTNDGCRCSFCQTFLEVKLQDQQGWPGLDLTPRPALPASA